MDDELRTSLWNVINLMFFDTNVTTLNRTVRLYRVAIDAQLNFFKKPIDDLPEYVYQYKKIVRSWFFSAKWFEIYDFVEFLRNCLKDENWNQHNPNYIFSEQFGSTINNALEREKSAYRFIGEHLSPIIEAPEIKAIEDATESDDRFDGARQHIRTALQLYSDRKSPDYRNSVKEAISAIESASCIIANDPKATLGQALKTIERVHKIHPAMVNAFDRLYGYASNSGGIRHAMLEEENVSEEEARFMLVACSAFLNFLASLTKA